MWQYEPPARQGVCETARLLAAEQLRLREAGVLAFPVRKFEFWPPIHGSRLDPVLLAYVATCGLSNDRPLRLRSGSAGSPTMEHRPDHRRPPCRVRRLGLCSDLPISAAAATIAT